MGQNKKWRRAFGQDHGLDEGHQIMIILIEAFNMTLAWVFQHAGRAALTTPIHGGHRKPAIQQLFYDLKILFYKLATTGKQTHRAPAGAMARRPGSIAQTHPVASFKKSRQRSSGHGVFVGFNKVHNLAQNSSFQGMAVSRAL